MKDGLPVEFRNISHNLFVTNYSLNSRRDFTKYLLEYHRKGINYLVNDLKENERKQDMMSSNVRPKVSLTGLISPHDEVINDMASQPPLLSIILLDSSFILLKIPISLFHYPRRLQLSGISLQMSQDKMFQYSEFIFSRLL